jgi:hypothetical protein
VKKHGLRGVVAAIGLCAALTALGQQQPKRPERHVPPPGSTPTPQPVLPPPAQPASTPKSTPAGSKPATQPAAQAPKKKEEPKDGPYVRQEQPRDVILTLAVRVNLDNPRDSVVYTDPFTGRTVQMPVIRPMKFNTLQFVFPVVPSTASSDLFFDEIRGKLTVNDVEADDKPEMLQGYPGPVVLTRWDAGAPDRESECRVVQLDMSVGMRIYNTKYDEAAAMMVGWPREWPEEVARLLQPQLFVELGVDAAGQIRAYDDRVLSETLSRWLSEEGLKDAKSASPARVAKLIAGKVWQTVQISGDGLRMVRSGELSGMVINPPSKTLEERRGTEQDVTALMAALYRKAGIPTRTVIGFDAGTGDAKFLQKDRKHNRLRSWVEFALYDEMNNTINWVPVDVARMRKTTNRPPPGNRQWPFFGSHDELNGVTPLAFHFHPPTDVVAYGYPGFWGWFVTPAPAQNAEQALRFVVTQMSKRGGELPRDPKRGRDGR